MENLEIQFSCRRRNTRLKRYSTSISFINFPIIRTAERESHRVNQEKLSKPNIMFFQAFYSATSRGEKNIFHDKLDTCEFSLFFLSLFSLLQLKCFLRRSSCSFSKRGKCMACVYNDIVWTCRQRRVEIDLWVFSQLFHILHNQCMQQQQKTELAREHARRF